MGQERRTLPQQGLLDSDVPAIKMPCPRVWRLSGPAGPLQVGNPGNGGKGSSEAGLDLKHHSVSPSLPS